MANYHQIESTSTKMTAGGRVVIPAEYRRALEMHDGDEIMVILDDGEVRLLTIRQALKRAQEIVRQYIPAGRSLSDELIAERREEAERE